MAPYVGALWTPPYWGYSRDHYYLHRGYWAPHVGFYGGVDYGHGYEGHGYEGGYWNRGSFYYNRSVNNVDRTAVHNVYDYRIRETRASRVSYNGGRGGIQERPSVAERAVLHENRIAQVPAQAQHMRQAQANRAQFASVNHGHPQTVAAARPLQTAYRAPAAHPAAVPGVRTLPRVTAREAAVPTPANRAGEHGRPAERNAPVTRPETRANEAHAPAPSANHPAAEARPASRPEPRTQPPSEHRAEPKPATQPRSEQRPASPPRAEQHPAPQTHPEKKATGKTDTRTTHEQP